jgi:hypothetical protein
VPGFIDGNMVGEILSVLVRAPAAVEVEAKILVDPKVKVYACTVECSVNVPVTRTQTHSFIHSL